LKLIANEKPVAGLFEIVQYPMKATMVIRTTEEPGISGVLCFSAVLCGLNLKMTHYRKIALFTNEKKKF
jgi:hypothetical protein